MACVDACPSGALRQEGLKEAEPWNIRAGISDHCLAANGTACATCFEACERDAITARPAMRGRIPDLNISE
jgi:ferredoxin